ncbi:alpha/beta fold hydrolase [Herbiconiux ginsengi]|uniref:Alpha/beta hydrolase family protein n=1 Tax=Herbiconiux ginsengi TaxID=381665 RepID=A0A1H3PL08_9MICO|nr:alpha/beta fold hydrolase [Herbiconiux ginsengi]SDZ01786.1 Alpha/beta hydrolase family protein [Herbiconiux ginsengi]
MARFVLLPGAGSDSWFWHLLVPRLSAASHEVLTVDLPWADERAGLPEYTDLVVDAIRSAETASQGASPDAPAQPIVLVAQSMGAFVAVQVCERLDVSELVLLAPMIPAPGETPGTWWENTGQGSAMRAFAVDEGRDPGAAFDVEEVFLHDLPADLVAESAEHESAEPADTPFSSVWVTDGWPDVPTRVIAGRYDRLFPLEFVRRIARERLDVEPEVIDTGHLTALVRPDQLAELLLADREGTFRR